MYIGARILKTGLAVSLAMLLCKYWQMEPAIFAAITVVLNMQSSVRRSLRNAWQQVAVHMIGVLLGVGLGLLIGNNAFVLGLATALVIVLCNKLKWLNVIPAGVLSVLFILAAPAEQFLAQAGTRSIVIFIGLGVALIVNSVLAPPRYKAQLLELLRRHFDETFEYFLKSTRAFVKAGTLSAYENKKPEALIRKNAHISEIFERAREEFAPGEHASHVERVLEICRGWLERGQNIEAMTAQRVRRRQGPGAPSQEITAEFQAILQILTEGTDNLEALKNEIVIDLKLEQPLTAAEVPEHDEYWNRLDLAIDEWQSQVTGVFYLRAMMEVAVVATEIRWTARRLKRLRQIGVKH
ncbi:MAG: aromatic acid exporter family protein [Peptococcaceae bacterium]|jgi:hypothetical protein|nr:aromatic acid exporter family protein [Peptococcaceae bacterium]